MGKRVLVVDDANFMRMVVKDTLAPGGFEIAGEATNGAEAARDILAADPDARIVMVTALGHLRGAEGAGVERSLQ